MKIVGIIQASALRERNLIEKLILALRFDGWSVSTIKRAPDGFALDQSGKSSNERRELGCREVMLVGDRRRVFFAPEDIDDLCAFLPQRLGPNPAMTLGRRWSGGQYQCGSSPSRTRFERATHVAV